jgi:outer membrane lipoprotein carrier protein
MMMMMRRSLVSVLLAVAVAGFAVDGLAQAPPGGAQTQAPTPQPAAAVADVTAKVQAFYDKTQSFRSDFTQEFTVKAYNQKKSSRGTVTFSKPGKMEWVYEDPKDNRVVSDGTTLRVYEAANKQMYEQGVDKSQYPAALAFLTGNGKLTDAFNLQLFDGEQMQFAGGWVLVGEPKQPNPAYTKVLFYVDKQTSQIRRAMIIDGQGNRNRFDFLNPRVNEPVNPNQFKFTPPPGTSIIRP